MALLFAPRDHPHDLRRRPLGLWTVCYHHNDWSAGDVKRFAADVAAYRARITSFADVASATQRKRSWQDMLVSTVLLQTLYAKRRLRGAITRVRGGS